MLLTMKDEHNRFGIRVGAIIFNHDRTKVFLQKQEKRSFYMFPGGRLEMNEDSIEAIKRELQEELGLDEKVKLKYIAESFIQFPTKRYHEIGYYFIVVIDEKKYGYDLDKQYSSLDEEHDGKSSFEWVALKELNSIELVPSFMKQKVTKTMDTVLEHIVYREY